MSKDQAPFPTGPSQPPSGPAQQARRKARIADAQQRAKLVADGPQDKLLLTQEDAESLLKLLLMKKHEYLRGVPAYDGAPAGLTRQQAYHDRTKLIQAVTAEISEIKELIHKLEQSITLIKTRGKNGEKVINNIKKVLEFQQTRLANLEATKEERLNRLDNFIKEFENTINELEEQEQVQRAFLNELQRSLIKKQGKPLLIKGSNQETYLEEVFKIKVKEFCDLAIYSPEEQLLIRNYYFENGFNDDNHNAFNCSDQEISLKMQADIELAAGSTTLTYTKLKNILGRNLFEDEKKPDRIAKAVQKIVTGTVGSSVPPDQVAINVVVNLLGSINIRRRCQKAGGTTFQLSSLKMFKHKELERQVADLQKAVDIAKLMLESTREPKLAFQVLDNAIAKLEKQLLKFQGTSQHKPGDALVKKALIELMKEVTQMKKALGIQETSQAIKNR